MSHVGDVEDDAGAKWAQYLVHARKARGLTQQNLASAIGVERKTISRWENGHTQGVAGNITKLARVLGVRASDMLGAAYGMVDGDLTELPPPLPRELARAVELYGAMGAEDQVAFLERIEWINQWAEMLLRQKGGRGRADG